MKPRHHVYLDDELTAKLDGLAAKPGSTKSAIVADALKAHFARRGAKEIDDLFKVRLDRLSRQVERVERDLAIAMEALALFVRYQFNVTPALPASEQAAANAEGQRLYDAFVAQIGQRLGRGRTLRAAIEGADRVETAP